MIQDIQEYQFRKEQAKEFEKILETFPEYEKEQKELYGIDPMLLKAEKDTLQTLLTRLQHEIKEYEGRSPRLSPEKPKVSKPSNDTRIVGAVGGNFVGQANVFYNMSGQNNKVIGDQQFVNYPPEQRQNLAEAAAEIQAVLEQLSQSYPTNTMAEKMALAIEATQRIENNPTLMQKTISALRAAGTAALEQALSHPAASFVIAVLDDWNKNNP